MSTLLKCPNPSCPYTFDPSQVPTGVVLSCPRCATQFTLGAPAAAPPAPPPAERSSSATNPFDTTAPTRAKGPPKSAPPAEAKPAPKSRRPARDADPDAEPAEGGAPPGAGRYQTFILVGIAAVLMAGTALVLVFAVMRKKDGDKGGSAPAVAFNSYNVALDAPPPGWQPDYPAEADLKPPFQKAYKRENPEGRVIFGFTEYEGGKRAPRGLELTSGLQSPFRRLFAGEPERDAAPSPDWMGLKVASPQHGFKFRARGDGLTWQGEAYAVTDKGVGYFWVGWCPEGNYDALKDEFAAFRGKFRLLKLLDKRKLRSSEFDFKGGRNNYAFTDTEALWVEVLPRLLSDTQKERPEVDRWLEVNHTPQDDKRALPDSGDLQIVVLDGAGAENPLQKAREFAETYWTGTIAEKNKSLDAKEQYPLPTFTERTGPPEGDPPGFDEGSKGKFATPVARLEAAVLDPTTKRNVADTEWRLVVVSGVRVKDKIIVMHCWCEFKKRAVFEARFAQIASSLRATE